ncbi:hypothetical protein ABZ636_03930 [Streptomyces sp. NPDC007251]|uniref:hypothetical protein n=1 Tax=Streptomyces sp. NPDC007251 TaxID=3154483 RepID=UPI0033F1EE2D
MEPSDDLTVKRITAYVPVSAEQLLDAGLPLPPGVKAPEARWRPSVLLRLKWWVSQHLWAGRRKLGFWIAGYEPDEYGW